MPSLRRYSGDPDVTRYVGWPAHRTVEETRAFLEYSDAEWTRWPAGPYLILAREGGRLLGGTGLSFETSRRAMTGYVLAADAWDGGLRPNRSRRWSLLLDRRASTACLRSPPRARSIGACARKVRFC